MVELVHALPAVRIARGVHLLEHERVAADRALAEDDQRTREDVGALDRDRYGDDLVTAPEIVARAELYALAAMQVHRVVRHLPAHFGDVVLEHGRRYRWLFAAIDGTGRDRARRVHRVGVADHARQYGFHALELA